MLEKIDQIDKSSPIPLYYQLKELILSEIKDGNYKNGDMIPTEKEISEAFHISRTTIRQAITELVQDGWLYRIKSKGTFVTQPKIPQEFIRRVESFNDQIYRLGMTPSTKVLALKKINVTEAEDGVKNALKLGRQDDVIYLYRKRMADGEPVVTVKTYLPANLCEFLLNYDFEKEQLYTLLKKGEDTNIFRIDRTVEAMEAKTEDQKLLGMNRGKPVLYFVSVGYNINGQPIEYSTSRYRGDRSKFEVTVFT